MMSNREAWALVFGVWALVALVALCLACALLSVERLYPQPVEGQVIAKRFEPASMETDLILRSDPMGQPRPAQQQRFQPERWALVLHTATGERVRDVPPLVWAMVKVGDVWGVDE